MSEENTVEFQKNPLVDKDFFDKQKMVNHVSKDIPLILHNVDNVTGRGELIRSLMMLIPSLSESDNYDLIINNIEEFINHNKDQPFKVASELNSVLDGIHRILEQIIHWKFETKNTDVLENYKFLEERLNFLIGLVLSNDNALRMFYKDGSKGVIPWVPYGDRFDLPKSKDDPY